LLDLCYEQLIYDPVPHNLPRVLTERMRARTASSRAATSKAYAMTGWRCGWVLAPKEVIAACNAIQSHSTSNVCSITQKAAVAALTGPQACVTEMLDEYRRRRDHIWPLLTADPSPACQKPAGAFYLFIDVSDLLSPDGLRTSDAFCQALLDEQHVVLTAGEAFDAPASCGCRTASTALLDEAARRIHRLPGHAAGVSRPCTRRLADAAPAGVRPRHVRTTRPTDGVRDGRARKGAPADIVVWPGSTRGGAAVMRVCARTRRAGGPAWCGHRVHGRRRAPRRRCGACLARLTASSTSTRPTCWRLSSPRGDRRPAGGCCGAGPVLPPRSLRAWGISTIGGNVAECAGGPRAFKYGVTRRYVLGLEAVLPGGEIIRTGGSR
jgi:hypothetical protein